MVVCVHVGAQIRFSMLRAVLCWDPGFWWPLGEKHLEHADIWQKLRDALYRSGDVHSCRGTAERAYEGIPVMKVRECGSQLPIPVGNETGSIILAHNVKYVSPWLFQACFGGRTL